MYAKISELDVIKLRDGRKGTILEVHPGEIFFTVERETSEGDWEIFDVKLESIESILWKNPKDFPILHGASLKYVLSDILATSGKPDKTSFEVCNQISLAS
jgi:hypothetical protein